VNGEEEIEERSGGRRRPLGTDYLLLDLLWSLVDPPPVENKTISIVSPALSL